MNRVSSILVVAAIATHALAQLGGGAASYGQQGRSGAEQARANELAKRANPPKDGARFVDAAVLMNVLADEYVATFGVNVEGKTLGEARKNMDAAVASFLANLRQVKVGANDSYVDFVAQNRIYGYEPSGDNAVREVVVGFEVKKNVIVRFKYKLMIDDLTEAASKAGVFDLVKVDYIVKDIAAVQAKLMTEASKILKRKISDQTRLLGVKAGQVQGTGAPQFSSYYPADMYDSYVAQESESMDGWRQGLMIQRARKPRTFYFNGLTGKDFDHVVNPVVHEPVVQFTVYVRLRY